ncbi:MAG: hypothetical protein P8049_02600 [Gemmatimonadota bacterium]|jgi:hypothetical protein
MNKTRLVSLLLIGGIGCGSSGVKSQAMAELEPIPDDEPVYLFVRTEELPGCPWETIGSIAAQEGWLEAQDERDAVSSAARRMGGQAVLLESREETEVTVIRFLDPFSLCDPRE